MKNIPAPRKQHFIPRSYLKSFAKSANGKFFVDIAPKTFPFTEDQIRSNISIRDICVRKDLYTDFRSGRDKFLIENFYAVNIDSKFTGILEFFLDPKAMYISTSRKMEVVLALLSLYFRTPKFVDRFNNGIRAIVDRAFESGDEKFTLKHEDRQWQISRENSKRVLKEIEEVHRYRFLEQHLKALQTFAKHKSTCAFVVINATENSTMITSDSPVSFHNLNGDETNIFDPNNFIEIPLSPSVFLQIYPDGFKDATRVMRDIRDESFFDLLCLRQHESADRSIIGYPGDLEKHLKNQIRKFDDTPENRDYVEKQRIRAVAMQELVECLQRNDNNIWHPEVISLLRKQKENPIINSDPSFQQMKLQIAKKGIIL